MDYFKNNAYVSYKNLGFMVVLVNSVGFIHEYFFCFTI